MLHGNKQIKPQNFDRNLLRWLAALTTGTDILINYLYWWWIPIIQFKQNYYYKMLINADFNFSFILIFAKL